MRITSGAVELFSAIRSSQHRYIGISADDSSAARTGAAAVQVDPNAAHLMTELGYALGVAHDVWPQASRWCLLGTDSLQSHETLAGHEKPTSEYPLGTICMIDPEMLCEFEA